MGAGHDFPREMRAHASEGIPHDMGQRTYDGVVLGIPVPLLGCGTGTSALQQSCTLGSVLQQGIHSVLDGGDGDRSGQCWAGLALG